jgi:amino acid permease
MPSQLFATKPHSMLLEELRGENRLRRVLGPVQLSSLGVGAIIGTGIFVLVGIAAHDRTGPALMLSFVAAGVTCRCLPGAIRVWRPGGVGHTPTPLGELLRGSSVGI